MSLISKRKGQFLFASILLILASLAFYFWKPSSQKPPTSPGPYKSMDPDVDTDPSSAPEGNPETPSSTLSPSHSSKNEPVPVWESSLRDSIIKQGGAGVKDLQITPLESRTWVHEGKSLKVETAKISFKDPSGREISFKAMVDQQTGKVLQTWDQPVIDDFSHKDDFGVKIDPRYLGQ